MKRKEIEHPQNVTCGKVSQSFEQLQKVVQAKANEIISTIEIGEGETKKVAFWTADIPELIGVATYKKENGAIAFDLDFSETTL